MIFYSWDSGALIKKSSLWEALRLSEERHRVIALVGGGGKTSTMFRLADELADMGKTVVVTTTTHIFRPSDREVVETDRAEAVERHLAKRYRKAGTVLVAGVSASGGKLKSMPLEEVVRLRECADVLLIEADGAKCLPIKVPREGEPVIPAVVDVVIACAGLDYLGGEMGQVCFRPELAAALLGAETGPEGGCCHRMTAGDGAVILTDGRAAKKDVDGRDYRVLLNKADDERLTAGAVQVIREIERRSPEICAVSCFR